MLSARIKSIASHLPSRQMTNDDLARLHPDWDMPKIESKIGIRSRSIASPAETASDLAFEACQKLFANPECDRSSVDYLLFCTQSPDYFLPTSACILQHRLGLRKDLGAMDFNLGCSGYVYGLSIAKGLIETGQASHVVLLTADTYSKFIQADDRSLVTLFGDGGTATWIEAVESESSLMGPFVFGTNGEGGPNLMVKHGGMRHPLSHPLSGPVPCPMHMDGPEILNFAIRVVPDCMQRLLDKAGVNQEEVDWFVFHQANLYLLEHLRKRLGIPPEKFLIHMADNGNTVSSTIPLVLEEASRRHSFKTGDRILLLGFGVGYSWAGTLLTWQ
jgi:3-oxoacyl-[acyl-carrier-protein] synthase-3